MMMMMCDPSPRWRHICFALCSFMACIYKYICVSIKWTPVMYALYRIYIYVYIRSIFTLMGYQISADSEPKAQPHNAAHDVGVCVCLMQHSYRNPNRTNNIHTNTETRSTSSHLLPFNIYIAMAHNFQASSERCHFEIHHPHHQCTQNENCVKELYIIKNPMSKATTKSAL